MLPFPIQLQAGQPIYEQVVHAVKRALATGHLVAGDRFPAVARLARNSDQSEHGPKGSERAGGGDVLKFAPARSFVAPPGDGDRREQARALEPIVEKLLIEASRLGLDEKQLFFLIHSNPEN